ncbi:hypothetical protein HY251_01380 [bacterium]|nr:hypothetical protein [bacterium]
MTRTLRFTAFCLAGFVLAGCSSLRYKKSEDLWVEGDARFNSGQYSDSVAYYDELLRRDDHDLRARRHRAIARDRSGATSDALDDYQKCADIGDAPALLYRANLDIKSGFFDAAERDLAALRGMSLDAHQQVAQLSLVGLLRLRQGNARMAVQSLERACEMARGQSDSFTLSYGRDAHHSAAHAYYQLGEFQPAMEHMEQYRQLAEATSVGVSGQDYYDLCIFHYLAGDTEGARSYLSKCDSDQRRRAGELLNDPTFFGS